MSWFAGDEVALMDEVIEYLADRTGSDVSELSHEFIGWQVAEMGEAIPCEAVFCISDPLDQEDIDLAKSIDLCENEKTQRAVQNPFFA